MRVNGIEQELESQMKRVLTVEKKQEEQWGKLRKLENEVTENGRSSGKMLWML